MLSGIIEVVAEVETGGGLNMRMKIRELRKIAVNVLVPLSYASSFFHNFSGLDIDLFRLASASTQLLFSYLFFIVSPKSNLKITQIFTRKISYLWSCVNLVRYRWLLIAIYYWNDYNFDLDVGGLRC